MEQIGDAPMPHPLGKMDSRYVIIGGQIMVIILLAMAMLYIWPQERVMMADESLKYRSCIDPLTNKSAYTQQPIRWGG